MGRSIRFERGTELAREDAVRAARHADHWSRQHQRQRRAISDRVDDIITMKRRDCGKGEF